MHIQKLCDLPLLNRISLQSTRNPVNLRWRTWRDRLHKIGFADFMTGPFPHHCARGSASPVHPRHSARKGPRRSVSSGQTVQFLNFPSAVIRSANSGRKRDPLQRE